MFPFFGGLNGDDYFPTEEEEEAMAEDKGMEEWYAEDSAGEDEDEWDDSVHWDQI